MGEDKEWDEMEKWVESQRETVQGHAGGAGDCLEGERGRLDADTEAAGFS